MTLPPSLQDEALPIIDAWCAAHYPPEMRTTHRLSTRVRGKAITIVEHVTRSGPFGADYERPASQLRLEQDGRWSLWWMDSRDRWHDARDGATGTVAWALAEIDRETDDLFFG